MRYIRKEFANGPLDYIHVQIISVEYTYSSSIFSILLWEVFLNSYVGSRPLLNECE